MSSACMIIVLPQAPRQMRVELWLSSLQRKGLGASAADKYHDMLRTVSIKAGAMAHRTLVASQQ